MAKLILFQARQPIDDVKRLIKRNWGYFCFGSMRLFFRFCFYEPHMYTIHQGSPTFLKLQATSCVPFNAKGY